MAKVSSPQWNKRPIAKDEDASDLDQRAAIYEFKHRMARPDAEHRAHHEYKLDKHREAAAYHLQGLKAAQHAGSQEEGHKHGLMYQLHMKALGLDPLDAVPHEIQSLADKQDKFYKFKPHRSDLFLLQDKDGGDVKKSEIEDLTKGSVVPFPGNPAPAQDQGQPAQVREMYPGPDCQQCHGGAKIIMQHLGNPYGHHQLQLAIGPQAAAIFREKYPNATDPGAHKTLTVLMHARHVVSRK